MNSLKRAFGTRVKQLVVKPRERIRFPRTTGRLFFILIKKYDPTSTVHSAHTISAVVSNGILFVFDPWGRDRKVTTDIIATKIATRYNLFLKIYNGPNLQAADKYGICTAFAFNFLRKFGTRSINPINFNRNVATTFRQIANNPNSVARTFELSRYGVSTIRRNRNALR